MARSARFIASSTGVFRSRLRSDLARITPAEKQLEREQRVSKIAADLRCVCNSLEFFPNSMPRQAFEATTAQFQPVSLLS